jgi:hypothetical protein
MSMTKITVLTVSILLSASSSEASTRLLPLLIPDAKTTPSMNSEDSIDGVIYLAARQFAGFATRA